MKNFLLAFIVFLIWSFFGMWYYSCIVKELCNDESDQIVFENVEDQKINSSKETEKISSNVNTSNSLEDEKDTRKLLFSFPEDLNIKLNQHTVSFPSGLESFQKKVFNFLNTNQEKELIITGLLNPAESTLDKSLGIKRAKYIKDVLVNYGINKDKISIEHLVQKIDFGSDGTFIGGILFRFENLSENKLKTIESGIANKILYSGFGSKEFRADKTLQAYAIELKNYLNKYPNKKAEIIGHTDSVGNNEANDWYGMERAKGVKKYLINQGIESNRLMASSKGEREPMESNATLEGRRKNRRIEIKIN